MGSSGLAAIYGHARQRDARGISSTTPPKRGEGPASYLEAYGFDAEADIGSPENLEALKRALLEEEEHAISVRVNESGALADLASFFARIGYPARQTSANTLEIEARHEGIETAQVRAAVELHVQVWLATRPNIRAESV